MIPQTDFSAIAALDLDPIKVKLMHKESGEGWSLEQANAVEFEYRRFLYLMKKFPNDGAAPRSDVDIFWHYHILDTIKYAQDCQAVFGYFLHHFPYLGLRGEDDMVAHERVGERMRELYEDTFGEPFLQGATAEKATRVAGRSAFSFAPPLEAPSASASRTAFSFAPPPQAASASSNRTAFSFAPPPQPESASSTRTAFSLAPPRQPESASSTSTAFSFAPPRQPESASRTSTAFSFAPPPQPESAADSRTAFSFAPPPLAMSASNIAARSEQAAGLATVRPSLSAAAAGH
jgi:hypothetical protein